MEKERGEAGYAMANDGEVLKRQMNAGKAHNGQADYLVALTDQASHRIVVMDPAEPDWNEDRAIVWTWAPETASGFEDLLPAWGLPTDAKLRNCTAWEGEWVVVTDSRGLAAIVPYPAGSYKKWGLCVGGNPHSAELLPNGNIAVAASTGGWIRVYASSQGPSSAHYDEYPFPGAHGVEWDNRRQLLWAVGDDYLVALSVDGTDDRPVLEEVSRTALPTRHGHDLQPVEGNPDRLWVSTGSRVYLFDKAALTFEPDPGYAGVSRAGVKSVGSQPSGDVVQTVPKAGGSLYDWTTDTVDWIGPDAGRRIRSDAAIYKARIFKPALRTGSIPTDPFAWAVGASYRLEKGKAFEEDLEAARMAGVRYLELAWRNESFNMFEPDNEHLCGSIIEKARAMGIDIWTLHLPYGTPWDISTIDQQERESALNRHLRLLRTASRWGIRTVVLHPSWEPVKAEERAGRLSACKQALASLSVEAERLNIRIAVECLPRTCLGNVSEEIAELMTAGERLGICCDVNHLVQETPESFIRKLGSRIITVHMSDNDGLDEKHWMPGTGVIRWPQVLEALTEAGYPGPFVFEVRSFDPAELMACWRRLLEAFRNIR